MSNKFYQQSNIGRLNVREEPSLSAVAIEQMRRGYSFEADEIIETPEVTWLRIASGIFDGCYVALKQNGFVYCTEIESLYSVYVPQELVMDNLPLNIFQLLPIDQIQLTHFYWYGNTRFAYYYGRKHNYHGYSQGLHGGYDFGTLNKQIPVYAGVHGYWLGPQKAFAPRRVDVLADNGVRVIYGHLDAYRTVNYAKNTLIYPDTVVGYTHIPSGHIHLEIRSADQQKIYNPYWFFPAALLAFIENDRPAERQYGFTRRVFWDQWLEQAYQPSIKINGPVIGPTA